MGRFVSIVSLLLLVACSTTTAPREQDQFMLEPDEARIWERANESIDLLHKSGYVIDDPELVSYLEGICKRLYPEVDAHPSEFEVLVLRDPSLNAFVYPNGVTCIHSGLIAAMESEAQLAMVLAHELAHFHERHSLDGFRHLKSQAAFHTALGVGTLGYGSLVSLVGFPAAISGHSRAAEREADRIGWDWFTRAGYAREEAAFAFEHLQTYVQEIEEKEPYFFGSHPHLQERIDQMHRLAATTREVGNESESTVGVEQLFQPVSSLLLRNAFLDLDIGNYARVSRLLDRFENLDSSSDRVEYLYTRAELLRRQANPEDREYAIELCERGIARDDNHAGLKRTIGQLYYENGDCSEAVDALREAVILDPDYPRNPFIYHYIELCEANLEKQN